MKFLQKILFYTLSVLPIIDYLFQFDDNSPAVLVRAGVTVFMSVLLLYMVLNHSVKLNSIAVLIFFLIFYMAVVTALIEGGIMSSYSFIKVIHPLIGFLLVYYLKRFSVLDEKQFAFFVLSLIIIYGVISFLNINNRIDYGRGLSVADNTGYSLVTLLAGVFLFANKKKTFFLLIFLITIGSLICGKRGAIVSLVFGFIPLANYIFSSYARSFSRKFFYILICIISGLFIISIFGNYIEATYARFESLEEDGGSGRSLMYQAYLYHYIDSDFFHQLFGHGLFAGQWGKYHRFAFINIIAHNDWLEMLFDFGLVGILIFLLFFYKFYNVIKNNRKNKNEYYYMLVVSIIVFGIKTVLSSTFFMSPTSIYMFMIISYAIAKMENRYRNKTRI